MNSSTGEDGLSTKTSLSLFSYSFDLSFDLFSLARILNQSSPHPPFPTRSVSEEEAERRPTNELVAFCNPPIPGLLPERGNFGTTSGITEGC